jgi:peptidyl-tRNA hydrolase, PTH1 family
VPLVVGLGNPGARYARTRHNVGWWVLERLIGRFKARPDAGTQHYRSWRCEVGGRDVTILAPLVFMNLSGEAIDAWRSGRELDAESMLVICDDVYLPVGELRVRPRGSSGGHRGLESVEAALGSPEYPRLRIGVGAVASDGLKEYVLDEPVDEERERLEQECDRAADAVECWLGEGILAAMNRFNRKVRREVPEP